MTEVSFLTSLISGGLAGTAVDVSLFPLDTIKTRLQSKQGFLAAGGFKNIYSGERCESWCEVSYSLSSSGLGPAAVGSAPNAALFFCTYDTAKRIGVRQGWEDGARLHMVAASLGEVTACLVRVPVEIVKQRRQASSQTKSLDIVRTTLRTEGLRGLYRGYLTTVAREIPFSLIQFPLWEFLKTRLGRWRGRDCAAWEASLCGAVAGGLAAASTTPLDVAKTRIMLAQAGSQEAKAGMLGVIRLVGQESGVRGLFAGVTPRVTWISIGNTRTLVCLSVLYIVRWSCVLRCVREVKATNWCLFMMEESTVQRYETF